MHEMYGNRFRVTALKYLYDRGSNIEIDYASYVCQDLHIFFGGAVRWYRNLQEYG